MASREKFSNTLPGFNRLHALFVDQATRCIQQGHVQGNKIALFQQLFLHSVLSSLALANSRPHPR